MSIKLMRTCIRFFSSLILFCFLCSSAWAGDTTVLTGKIVDVDGRPVEGARVFVYDSADVRRSAQFISALSGKDGSFRIVMPPGTYWAMARLKKSGGYGPLAAGDKHSGEAEEIELGAGREISMMFTVADLREVRRMRSGDREGTVRLSGRVLDAKGVPVPKTYVIANKTEKISGMPDYLSAWTDKDGSYTLYIPRGIYYLGAASQFPPKRGAVLKGPVTIEADRADLDIAGSPPASPEKPSATNH